MNAVWYSEHNVKTVKIQLFLKTWSRNTENMKEKVIAWNFSKLFIKHNVNFNKGILFNRHRKEWKWNWARKIYFCPQADTPRGHESAAHPAFIICKSTVNWSCPTNLGGLGWRARKAFLWRDSSNSMMSWQT